MNKYKKILWSDIPKGERVKFVVGKIMAGELSLRGADLNAIYKISLSILIICEDYIKKHPFTDKEFIIRTLIKEKNNHNIRVPFVFVFRDLIEETFDFHVTEELLSDALILTPVVTIEEYKNNLETMIKGRISDLKERERIMKADLMSFVHKEDESEKRPNTHDGFQQLFIKKAKMKYGDYYDYSRVIYEAHNKVVSIGCPNHGYFDISPDTFLRGVKGYPQIGCPECGKIKKFQDTFLERAYKKHAGKYEYPNIPKSAEDRVFIRCKIHGFFEQTARQHLYGHGCPDCAENGQRRVEIRKKEFIEKSKARYGNLFDYSNVRYVNKNTPVLLHCNKHNYDFYAVPDNHIRRNSGCPYCNDSTGEIEVRLVLERLHIPFKAEYNIPNENPQCRRSVLRVDFWLPDHNTIVEFQGEQHFMNIPHFYLTKEWTFEDQQIRDQTLRDYCTKHNIHLIEIRYDQTDNIEKILKCELHISKPSGR